MSNFDETLIKRLTKLEREVERLKVKESPIMSNYLLTTGKAADSDKLDGIDSTGFATAGHNHDDDYIPLTDFAWQNWTPSIGYWGGTTNPTSLTINEALYIVVGKIVFYKVSASLVRGSGDQYGTTFSVPISQYGNLFVATATHYITNSGLQIPVALVEGNLIKIYHGEMASDGWIHVNGFYRIQ